MLFVAAILALVIGLSLGLLGGGGSILTLPILVYVLHQDAKEAIAASLFVVGTTAFVSAISHARARNVDYRTGAIFGAASMAGAFAGGKVVGNLPGNVLLGAFAWLAFRAPAASATSTAPRSSQPAVASLAR